jgi:demethylmenaquinone methyltransferase/2-methoxy-6-polyprenyl-1,4-benzoquinol methylase
VAGSSESNTWLETGEAKRSAVKQMFSEIAPTYDKLNGIMTASLHHRWRKFAAKQLNLQPGSIVLDLCSGTGDFLLPLRQLVGSNGKLVSADFCEPMLKNAQQKDPEAAPVTADACQLPFRSNTFDGVTVGWGIRNVHDIDAAHSEICRVLKDGGKFVSIDMAVPQNPLVRKIARFAQQKFLPWLGKKFGHGNAYTYLSESTQLFKSRQELKEIMEKAGFENVYFRDLFMGSICVHVGTKGASKC